MTEITISTYISEDRKLVVDVPDEFPAGRVNVTITSVEQDNNESASLRDIARAKLLAAGSLATNIEVPPGTVPMSPEEILKLGTLPPNARPSHELIDEDRGEY